MRRWLWLLLIPVIVGLARLRFDVDVLNLLPGDLPVVRGLQLYQRHFAGANELIVTVEGDESERTEAAAKSLAEWLRREVRLVADAHWQSPWLEHPELAAELVGLAWLNQPPELFRQITNQLAQPEKVLAETRERLANSMSPEEIARSSFDPFGLTRLPLAGSELESFGRGDPMFAASDGLFRVIFVKPATPLGGYPECAAWIAAVRQKIAAWEASEGKGAVRVHFTGRPAFVAEIAAGMERDIRNSVLGTLVIIALLFGWAYRSWRPLLWLVVLLTATLVGTLALGGLLIGTLNVVSLGFAAILLGLVVDYGLVVYQEALANPGQTAAEVRRHSGSGILWSAITTAGAFLILNLSALPGLGQLGTLVALGIGVGAVVMTYVFLPIVLTRLDRASAAGSSVPGPRSPEASPFKRFRWGPLMGTVLVLAGSGVILMRGLPPVSHSADPLRPLHSEAYTAAERLNERLGEHRIPLWLVITGRDESAMARRLQALRPILQSAVSNQVLSQVLLPDLLWPQPENQRSNQETARWLVHELPNLQAAATRAGFTSNALWLTRELGSVWSRAGAGIQPVWPTNAASTWTLERFVARGGEGFLIAGLAYAGDGVQSERGLPKLMQELSANGAWMTGWTLLGEALLGRVEGDLGRVLAPMLALLLLSLWFAFRRWGEVLLSVAALLVAALVLLVVMRLAGWSWNLLNFMAVPLLLGSGVDYGIHQQLTLRRFAGDQRRAWQSTGRALLLCAATTVVGFGSLVSSGNGGLASLGAVCATGIAASFLVAVGLLPGWWLAIYGQGGDKAPDRPSTLYGRWAWQAGLLAVRVLPSGLVTLVGGLVARVYWGLQPARRGVVVENLLPLCGDDPARANAAAFRLVKNFARKVTDLWRFEGGGAVLPAFRKLEGWERFEAAQAGGRGVLLVTLHLGNWELGGPILTHKGHRLLALSNPEPDSRLTQLRQAARARWGVETLIVGDEPFAFVEVIRHLGQGTAVALLLDRPAGRNAVAVELFGRPFPVSNAAAELARASGCAVLPVVILHDGVGYTARILPEVGYDRAALGDRERRRLFTGEILRAFEPSLRQFPDQWYHFVPVWPRTGAPEKRSK